LPIVANTWRPARSAHEHQLPQEEGESYFSAFFRRPQHICLLAEADGETAGYLSGYLEQPDSLRSVKSAELESMYAKEGHRDKGIGERGVQDFLNWCRDNGAAVVPVTAYASNLGAILLYQRYGFKPLILSLEAEIM
jgi:GNAT superfamily N-acetyltransferase